MLLFAQIPVWVPLAAAQPAPSDPAAALVGDTPIYRSQVEGLFREQFAQRQLKPHLADAGRAAALEQLVNQQLVMDRLATTPHLASEDEVDLEVARFAERLEAHGETLDSWLAEQQQSLAALRFTLRWQVTWKRYLDQVLTDEVLEKFFQRHRREFDGTRLRVAHLLLVPGEDAGPDAIEKAVGTATELRNQILAGTLSWEDAVRQHSQAPTAGDGGELGWIEFERPMPPDFTEAAWKLEADGISEPVTTAFGVHLIKCVEVEQGTLNWYHVKKPLRSAATRELFRLFAERQRRQTTVRFTGATPWRDPESQKLMDASPEGDESGRSDTGKAVPQSPGDSPPADDDGSDGRNFRPGW
jgi:parvulin-like peptidyl-prolyl isomerase